MATFQRYPAYKDSGEYWLGEIPEHWELKKLKHVFQEKKKVTNPNLSCGSISFGKVVYKNDEKVTESTKASYQEVLAGEYLVNPLNLNYDLVSLRIGLSDINVVVSSGYIVLKNAIALDKSYFNYLLHRYDVAYMKLLGSGVRQTISFNHIANSLLAYPPMEEQAAIATFLDEKTAKIDRAIAQKEKMIALLKERKQIIIQNAVTKGLNPNAKMKHSGVEWIGEIPEGWEVKKLPYVTTLVVDGTHFSPKSYDQGEFKYITAKNIKEHGFDFTDLSYVTKNSHEMIYPRCPVKKGDIMYIKDGATAGIAMINNLEEEFSLLSSVALIRVKECLITPNYMKNYLNSSLLKNFIKTQIVGGALTRLTLELINQFRIISPPLNDQHSIVAHIEAQSAKIDKAIGLQEQQIEKLKELKATLIDGAVTGKIKII